jgi:hypothetical protein
VIAVLLGVAWLPVPARASAPLRGTLAPPARRSLQQSGYMQSAPLSEDQAFAAVQRRPSFQPGGGGSSVAYASASAGAPKAGRGYPGPSAYPGYGSWGGHRRLLAQPGPSGRCVCAFDFDQVRRCAAWMPCAAPRARRQLVMRARGAVSGPTSAAPLGAGCRLWG